MSLKSILLVENDVNLRQSIALVLQRAGYLVTATDCIERAIEILTSRHYQLVIVDSNITEGRTSLLPKLRSASPDLPVIVLTDQSSLEVESEKRLSRAHYLLKPIAPERLLEAVSSNVKSNNHKSLLQSSSRSRL